MKFTNHFGIPDTVMRAIRADNYSRGDADISVTGLLRPAQMAALEKRYHHSLEVDARDEVWKLWGQAVHAILERANEGQNEQRVEKRLFMEIAGMTISGQPDAFDESSNTLTDYKVTTEFGSRQDKIEWEEQANCYRLLWHEAEGIDVDQLQIVAILRDWRRADAERNPEYAQAPVVTIPIKLWPLEEARDFVLQRIVAHKEAKDLPDEQLPPCTDEERWKRPITFAVKKRGGKRALRVFKTEHEAKAFLASATGNNEIETRGGEAIRCQSWCSVSQFCNQWKNGEEENGK